MILEVTFINDVIIMKCHYFGWIRSFLDPHFLVYAYNKSGTLYPDSSLIKVNFDLCCVNYTYIFYVVKVPW